MNKLNKVRTGIFALAMMLLCNPFAFAQSGKSSAPGSTATVAKSDSKSPAAAALKNFKADASNPELSQMQLSLLKAKAELEKGISGNTMSQEEIASWNQRIGLMETKVNAMVGSAPKTREVAMREQAKRGHIQGGDVNEILRAKQLTRAQFTALSGADQKLVMYNYNDLTITDLVNATPEVLKYRQDHAFYIAAADFKGYDISKQIHILNNPSNYIVVQNASVIPVNTARPQDPAINTYKISRAELNSFSPERRKAIEESKNIEITD